MKIAFIYNADDPGMSGTHWTNNAYRYFVTGLRDIHSIDYETFPIVKEFDARQFEGFDAVIIYSMENLCPIALDQLDAIKVVRTPDPHSITDEWIAAVDQGEVDFVINHHSPVWARKWLPDHIRYEQVIFGITEQEHCSAPWGDRNRRILHTGAMHRADMYELRRLTCAVPGIVRWPLMPATSGDKFGELLQRYKAGIAACTVSSVYKYFEIPACGCLSFMEVNEGNGCGDLGFVDGESAVFIDTANYKDKIREFVKSPQDKRWRTIANNGRKLVMGRYENKAQILRLINLIEGVAV